MKKLILYLVLAGLVCRIEGKVKVKHIKQVDDIKEYKKVLKTHKNVMTIYSKDDKAALPLIRWMEDVAKDVKGKGTFVYINCGETKESKKLCKKFDIRPKPILLKHYKDGAFNKDYDRKDTPKSMLNFMLDPTGDAPWEEDPASKNVVHVTTEKELIKLRRKEKGPLLIMFYAPWCGYCKKLKPEYSSAANELKDKAVLAGMNVDKPETQNVRYEFNITGFPTIVYFEKGEKKFNYGGGMDKDGIVSWMNNPEEKADKKEETEEAWSDTLSEIVHLTDATFEEKLKENPSMLIMFYAPWCGHCKKMKPEYTKASITMKGDGVNGTLAAVDCTVEKTVCKKYDVSGYPTVKYFAEGEYKFKVSVRDEAKIVEFMKKPEAPPPPPPEDLPWAESSGPEIIHLDDGTYKEILKKKKHVLVMFYAPWCGHCKKAKPEIQEAADHYKEDRKIWYAGVDCTIEKKMCDLYGVQGYPTFRYFLYGKKDFKYSGGRTTQAFIDFMVNPQEKDGSASDDDAEPPQWKDTPSGVVHLEDSDFDEFTKTHSSVLVMFYAPWCGHCKQMKPDYTEAANELLNQDHVLAAVDCTKNRRTASAHDINGYPTLKYFKDGVGEDYNGGRSKSNIIQFLTSEKAEAKAEEAKEDEIEEEAPPPPPEAPVEPPAELQWSDEDQHVAHLTEDTFDEFMSANPSAIVMFYAPWCGHCKKMKPIYTEAAKRVNTEDEVPGKLTAVDCVANKQLCNRFGITGYPKAKYFKDGEFAHFYSGGKSADAIVAFMKDPKAPPPKKSDKLWPEEDNDVIHLTGETFEELVESESSVLVMFYAPWCGHCKKMKPQYDGAAKVINTDDTVAGKLAAVDCTGDGNDKLCKKYGVRGYPTVKYFKDGKEGLKYSGGRKTDDLIEFMKDPKEPAPKPVEKTWAEEDTDVVHLTKETFKDIVKSETHVLVMFYAPWCGHCKQMKPAFAEAAKLVNNDEQIDGMIAAVDCDAHPSINEKYEIKGYPTIKYFRKGRDFLKYDGARDADSFVEYIKTADLKSQKQWSDEPSEVHHLTNKTFHDFLKDKDALVMFYAPWCGHCNQMKPAYMEAAQILKDDHFPGVLAAIDATQARNLSREEGARGYPTLRYYSNGKFVAKFEEHRTLENLLSFMKKQFEPDGWKPSSFDDAKWIDLPSSVTHLTSDNFHSVLDSKDVPHVLVAFHIKWCKNCLNMRNVFMKVASRLPGSSSIAAIDCDIHTDKCSDQGVTSFPTMKYYNYGSFNENYSGKVDSESVLNYVLSKLKEGKDEL